MNDLQSFIESIGCKPKELAAEVNSTLEALLQRVEARNEQRHYIADMHGGAHATVVNDGTQELQRVVDQLVQANNYAAECVRLQQVERELNVMAERAQTESRRANDAQRHARSLDDELGAAKQQIEELEAEARDAQQQCERVRAQMHDADAAHRAALDVMERQWTEKMQAAHRRYETQLLQFANTKSTSAAKASNAAAGAAQNGSGVASVTESWRSKFAAQQEAFQRRLDEKDEQIKQLKLKLNK